MAYVNSAQFQTYLSTYGGTDISSEDNFEQFLELATLDIDTATYNRIDDITLLSTHQQSMIRNAVCSHAQTLYDYGDIGSQISENRQVSLGDLSVSGSSSNILDRMSNRTKDFLSKSGLSSNILSYGANRGYWYKR